MHTIPKTHCLVTLLLVAGFVGTSHGADIKQWTQRADTEEARVVLQEVTHYLTEQPNDYAAMFLQARLQAKQGETAAAIKTYQQLIKLQPNAPEAYNNLAAIYAQQGDYEQAQKLLEQAMQTHSGYATVYENLGQIYVERARDSYGKALQLDAGKQKLTLQEATSMTVAQLENVSTPAPVTATVNNPVEQSPPVNTVTESKVSIDKDAIITTLQGWAAAWSEQAPDVYLIFYADVYAPDGLSRVAWEAQRRERLQAPAWIQVGLSEFKVEKLANGDAKVEMIQDYRASNYQDKTRKRMQMRHTADGWRIVDEQTLAAMN